MFPIYLPPLCFFYLSPLTICHSCLATEEAFLAKERDGKGDSVAIAGFLFVKVFDVAQTLSREEAVKRREFISACHIFTPSLNCTLRIKESFSHIIDNCHYYTNTYRKLQVIFKIDSFIPKNVKMQLIHEMTSIHLTVFYTYIFVYITVLLQYTLMWREKPH